MDSSWRQRSSRAVSIAAIASIRHALQKLMIWVSPELFVHLLAIGTSLGVMILSFRDVFWKDVGAAQINSGLKAFQFAARVHEIILSVSTSTMVLGVARQVMLHGQGLPFGMLMASYNIASLTTFLCKEFWASLTVAVRLQKLMLGILMLSAAAFLVLAGPLSAILIIPQLGWWHESLPYQPNDIHGTAASCVIMRPHAFFTNQPETAYFGQSCLESGNFNNSRCPTGGYNIILDNANHMMRNISLNDNMGSLTCLVPQRFLAVATPDSNSGQTVSSVLTPSGANDPRLAGPDPGQLLSSSKYVYTFAGPKTLRKPVVEVSCESSTYNTFGGLLPVDFLDGSKWSATDAEWRRVVKPTIFTENSTYFWHFEWLNFETTQQLRAPSAGALFAYTSPELIPMLAACTIEASWVPITAWMTAADNNMHDNETDLLKIYKTSSPPSSESLPFPRPGHIIMNSSYLEALNPSYGRRYANDTGFLTENNEQYYGNQTFSWMTRMMQVTTRPAWSGPLVPVWSSNNSEFLNYVSSLIGMVVADALARSNVPVGAKLLADCTDDSDQTGRVSMIRERYGFGWRVQGTEVGLAISGLLLHIVATLIYLVWICCSARARTNKVADSAGQMLLLAVQAEPNSQLHTADARAPDEAVWPTMVNLRDDKSEALQLVFNDVTERSSSMKPCRTSTNADTSDTPDTTDTRHQRYGVLKGGCDGGRHMTAGT